MANVVEKYTQAVHASSLKPTSHKGDEGSGTVHVDVLGAFGLADKHLTEGWVTTGPEGQGYRIKESPLAVPLSRLFAGDHGAAHAIVRILAGMAWDKGQSMYLKPKLGRAAAHDLAIACLAWHMGGTCKVCGGHGYSKIPGAPKLSERECEACDGTGKIPFEDAIDPTKRNEGLRDLARWLVVEMTREAGNAAPVAMRALSARMEL
jgi:hypothetical protein